MGEFVQREIVANGSVPSPGQGIGPGEHDRPTIPGFTLSIGVTFQADTPLMGTVPAMRGVVDLLTLGGAVYDAPHGGIRASKNLPACRSL
jgi:hypothetical protein